MTIEFACHHCGKFTRKPAGSINRAKAAGLNIYCSRVCSGLDRRSGKTKAERVAEKAAYDREYRRRDPEALKARKAEYHRRTYDPVKAAADRALKMHRHVE